MQTPGGWEQSQQARAWGTDRAELPGTVRTSRVLSMRWGASQDFGAEPWHELKGHYSCCVDFEAQGTRWKLGPSQEDITIVQVRAEWGLDQVTWWRWHGVVGVSMYLEDGVIVC